MTTSIPRIFAQTAARISRAILVFFMSNAPVLAEGYPVRGVWVAHNRDFPIALGEICSAVKMSGVEAVGKKLISELLLFNENKRYVVKQSTEITATLVSTKQTEGGYYWITELLEARRRFWLRQKTTYLLRIVDPGTIEIQSDARKTTFINCGPRGRISI
jgi:hypothetical protein